MAAEWKAAHGKPNRRITYERRGGTWFVVSGTDVRGIEFYEKFTMSGQEVAFLNITFPRSRLRQYESWVEQIEDGFRLVALRNGPAALVQPSSRSRERTVVEQVPADRRNPAESAVETKRESKPTELPEKKPRQPEAAPAVDELPSAEKVAGKSGFVYSPSSPDRRLVDVTDILSGTKVKCPYTMKIFRVP